MSNKYPGNIVTSGAAAGYSVYFDGSGDYLQVAANAALTFGTGAFTVEAWLYATAGAGTDRDFISNISSTGDSDTVFGARVNTSNTITTSTYASNLVVGTISIALNTWTHYLFSFDGTTYRQFINGVLDGTPTTTVKNLSNSSNPWTIGRTNWTSRYFTGYVSNARIVKGTALYTAAFTPPTQLFATSVAGSSPSWSASLLTCNSPAIVDQSSNAFSITVNGNSAVSTFTPFAGYTAYNPALGASTPGIWTVSDALQARQTRRWNMYDPYFNLTTLYLPGNGTNGAQNNTFLDSSSNNFSITRNGNTTQGTFSPFSQTGWSNYFNGSNATLQTTALNISTGNFTVEAWVNLNAMPTSDSWPASYQNWIVVVGVGTASLADGWQLRLGTTQIAFGTNSDTTAVTGAHGISIGNWYHIAAVRSGNVYTLYVNGVQVASATYTANAPGTGAFTWIGSETGQSSYVNGYISNVRVTSGALYSGTFTPSTTPLSTTVSAGTALLLTCQDNRFKDNSSNGYTFTINGAPSVQAFSPFYPVVAYTPQDIGGSGYFDGSGDNLNAGDKTNFEFGSGDFTVEAWVYPTSSGSNQLIVAKSDGASETGSEFDLRINSSNFGIYTYIGASTTSAIGGTLVINQWNHVAATRNGTNLNLYLNGSRVANTNISTNSLNATASSLTVGSNAGASQNNYSGYISGVRVLKGSAQYTGTTYTVPTAPPTAITNTQLLLNFTNGGIIDATGKNVLETVGNAQISTTQSKFGGSSMYFDGTTSYLYDPPSVNNVLGTGDFTLECWVYATSTPADVGIFESRSNGNSATADGFTLTAFSGSVIRIFSNGALISSSGTSYVNTWCHVAVTRLAGVFNLYINGVSQGTSSAARTFSNSDAIIGGGRYSTTASVTTFFPGYIDDFRITKFCRYTGNFTPPTSALQQQ